MAALNVSAILDALCTSHGDKLVRGEVSTWLGAVPAKAAKKSKAKATVVSVDSASDGDAPAAKGAVKSAWTAFVKTVCGPPREPTSGYAAWLEEHPEHEGKGHLVGARSKYASAMKGDDDCDYNAFKAEFKSGTSSGGSADGSAAPAPKPKRKPGRPSKAEKAAGAGDGGAVISLTDSEDEMPKPKPKAKKAPGAPKKAAKSKELPPLPASDDEDITRIMLFDQEFYWDSTEETLYEVKEDGTRGNFCGTYNGVNAHFG